MKRHIFWEKSQGKCHLWNFSWA